VVWGNVVDVLTHSTTSYPDLCYDSEGFLSVAPARFENQKWKVGIGMV